MRTSLVSLEDPAMFAPFASMTKTPTMIKLTISNQRGTSSGKSWKLAAEYVTLAMKFCVGGEILRDLCEECGVLLKPRACLGSLTGIQTSSETRWL